MTETISSQIESVRERITSACERSGRPTDDVRLMAVTKTQPREAVKAAYEAGIRLFGENRVQEAAEKYAEIPSGAELHLVGHLQRNKARVASELFSAVHSIDKVSTAEALSRHLASGHPGLRILYEVNVSKEETKEGVQSADELWRLIEGTLSLPGITPCGFMTIASFTDDTALLRSAFRHMVELRDEALRRFPEHDLRELSMGMTNDYTVAIEEGATIVRIGTALFGARGG